MLVGLFISDKPNWSRPAPGVSIPQLIVVRLHPTTAAIPGNTFPSRYSNIAPPPVLT
jgi:hypothetical protein